jgi:wyosine [tRNA(Phe)-imidazoG37] synthetase (radical SAM superfamily)
MFNATNQQLQTLTQFAAVLSLLANPEELKSVIEKTQKMLDDEKELMGPRRSLVAVEAYKQEMEKKYNGELAQLREERVVETTRVERAKEQENLRLAKLQEQEKDLNERMASLVKREETAKELLSNNQAFLTSLEAREKELKENQKAVDLLKQELSAKQDQLKQILG